MAKNNVQSVSYLLGTQVIKPQIIQKAQNQYCTQIYIKHNIHKHRTQNFRRISPFGITPVKNTHTHTHTHTHIGLGHAGIVNHYVDLSIADFIEVFKKKKKGEWTEAI